MRPLWREAAGAAGAALEREGRCGAGEGRWEPGHSRDHRPRDLHPPPQQVSEAAHSVTVFLSTYKHE